MARNKKQGDKFNAPFATSLRQLIEDRNVTQGDIASVAGVTRQTVSQYCNGISEPCYDTLTKIADYFNVSIDYLLGRTGDPNRQASAIDDLGLSLDAVETLKACSSHKGAIYGISIMLTMPDIVPLAISISNMTCAVIFESERSHQIGEKDIDKSKALLAEIEEKHPELAGRLYIQYGRAALDTRMHDINTLFDHGIGVATGYQDYLCGTL